MDRDRFGTQTSKASAGYHASTWEGEREEVIYVQIHAPPPPKDATKIHRFKG